MSAALALSTSRLVRRFCACELERVCGCGAPAPRSGWTVSALAELWELMREHGSLSVVASLLARTQRDCNLALDALLGKTPAHALAVLEAQAERRAAQRPIPKGWGR